MEYEDFHEDHVVECRLDDGGGDDDKEGGNDRFDKQKSPLYLYPVIYSSDRVRIKYVIAYGNGHNDCNKDKYEDDYDGDIDYYIDE